MKRLSLRRMGDAAERAVRRFPLVLVSAILAATFGAIMADASDEHPWAELMMTAQLGIPLFLALGIASGRRTRQVVPRTAWLASHLLGVAILVLFYFTRSGQLADPDLILFVQLNVGFHLLVAVLPFAGRGETRAMWQFNVTLLLRFITAVFFSAVLFAGLSVALLALDTLFGMHVADETYLQLWFVIAFVFNTAYVLGGIPQRLRDLEDADTYPRMLRVFAQYILAPLVLVYLAILTAYLIKVVTTGEWPSGWIGWLVSSVAAAGILSLLLLKPELDRPERRAVRIYARIYHWLMVPAVVMLALAILKRIGQYGVTENRYFLLVLTVWLAAVVVAGCLRRRPLVKAIPATLGALAFLTAIGPWSAGDVSHRSQLARLEHLLVDHERLANGVIARGDSEVAAEASVEMGSVLRYLFRMHGPGALDGLVSDALQADLDAEFAKHSNRRPAADALSVATFESMNLEPGLLPPAYDLHNFNFHRVNRHAALAVGDHAYVIAVRPILGEDVPFDLAGDPCRLKLDWKAETLTILREDQPLLTLPLTDLIARLRLLRDRSPVTTVADEKLVVTARSTAARGELHLDEISWTDDDDGGVEVGHIGGTLLLSLDPDPNEHRE